MPDADEIDDVETTGIVLTFPYLIEKWQDFANCQGANTNMFFPKRGFARREIKIICQSCVVRQDCLDHAIANNEEFGIWGGLSETERRRIRAK